MDGHMPDEEAHVACSSQYLYYHGSIKRRDELSGPCDTYGRER
jgi:hypothetical protein